VSEATTHPKRLNVFERYLTVWVASCMLAGVLLGKLLPGVMAAVRGLEFGRGSHINLPIAVLMAHDLPDDARAPGAAVGVGVVRPRFSAAVTACPRPLA
jgi:hypothetical protein